MEDKQNTNTPGLRFKVGDRVRYSNGVVGVIDRIDLNDQLTPYRVDAEEDGIGWLSQSELSPADQPPSPSSILTEAESIVSGRDSTYGTPERNLERIAARWATVFGHPVTPEQVCICMIDVKLSRLTQTPGHRDSLVDVVGYARLYEVTQKEKTS